MFLQMEKDRI